MSKLKQSLSGDMYAALEKKFGGSLADIEAVLAAPKFTPQDGYTPEQLAWLALAEEWTPAMARASEFPFGGVDPDAFFKKVVACGLGEVLPSVITLPDTADAKPVESGPRYRIVSTLRQPIIEQLLRAGLNWMTQLGAERTVGFGRIDKVEVIPQDEGATLVEYGLLVALIAMAAIVAIKLIGTNASTLLSNAANSIK